jgi:hypothetical protein
MDAERFGRIVCAQLDAAQGREWITVCSLLRLLRRSSDD